MQWRAEFCDDKEYQFFHHHLCEEFEADTCQEAMDKALLIAKQNDAEGTMEDTMIAQLCRPFVGSELSQPVYDLINGWMREKELIDQAKTWQDLFGGEEELGDEDHCAELDREACS